MSRTLPHWLVNSLAKNKAYWLANHTITQRFVAVYFCSDYNRIVAIMAGRNEEDK